MKLFIAINKNKCMYDGFQINQNVPPTDIGYSLNICWLIYQIKETDSWFYAIHFDSFIFKVIDLNLHLKICWKSASGFILLKNLAIVKNLRLAGKALSLYEQLKKSKAAQFVQHHAIHNLIKTCVAVMVEYLSQYQLVLKPVSKVEDWCR